MTLTLALKDTLLLNSSIILAAFLLAAFLFTIIFMIHKKTAVEKIVFLAGSAMLLSALSVQGWSIAGILREHLQIICSVASPELTNYELFLLLFDYVFLIITLQLSYGLVNGCRIMAIVWVKTGSPVAGGLAFGKQLGAGFLDLTSFDDSDDNV